MDDERERSIGVSGFATILVLVIALVLLTALLRPMMAQVFQAVESWIMGTFGWFYILIVTLLLVFVVGLAFSPYARVKLGPQDSEPEFSRIAWLTMLFAAGMGIGLVFWGVAEPVIHYDDPPMAEAGTREAQQEALLFSFFHWGLHAWAIYLVVALSLAFFHYRHDLPLAPRSLLYPLLKDRIHGPAGWTLDVLVVFATLFGLAVTLGLGALQIATGVETMTGLGSGPFLQLVIIAVVVAIAVVSVTLGVSRGIRRLSHFNLALAALLLLFVLVVGPTRFLLESFLSGTGHYLAKLPEMSLFIGEMAGADPDWQQEWTLFYWGWWMSWAPFVGLFIARISRGRTIREFVISALVVPTLFAFLWFSVFGGTAIWVEENAGGGVLAATQEAESRALYALLAQVPVPAIASLAAVLATLLVLTFFVTSIDSGSLVTGIVASGQERPGWLHRVVWALIMGLIAGALLLLGGLDALQTAAISLGLPMGILLVVACMSLLMGLRREREQQERLQRGRPP